MIKTFFLLFIMFLATACEAEPDSNGVDTKLTDAEIHQQLKYMQQTFKDTPYAALVKITSVKVIDLPDDDPNDDYAEQKLVYQANVIDTYRGAKRSQLSYEMIVEKGDSVEPNDEPFILTLCQSQDGFYWPGVGASFSADKRLIALAKKLISQLDNKQTSFMACDE